MKRLALSVIVILLMACAPVSQPRSAPAPAFRAAVEAHLAAVASRDMDALLPTLTTSEELTMIGPDGSKFDTREQYVDFHRQWFATEDDGRFTFEIVRTIEYPALAHALVRYAYRSRGASGEHQSNAWLTLTFALEDGVWRLVFDQNTTIAPRPNL